MKKNRKPKLALIDSHALIHRAYHALPPMSTREGLPTNAVLGFTTMLLKMFSTLKPTHVVAAFDMAGPTFRVKDFAEYKAHRAKADDELIAQFDIVRKVVRAFGIPLLEKQGFEADDIIGTLVAKIDGDIRKVIVTGDMDTLQLIDDDTSVFTLKRGVTDTILYDEAAVKEKYGFGPEHVVDYKGLRGDPSDNIPGVAGVGEKTASELIQKYGSVEEIFKHLDELPEKFQKKLKGKKQEALLSKKLATIKRDVPLDFDLEDAVLEGYDSEAVRRLFAELEFRSLLQRLPGGGSGIQPTLFAGANKKSETGNQKLEAAKLPKNYHIIETKAQATELKKELRKAKIVAFDTENDALGARRHPIVGMSFAHEKLETRNRKLEAYYVPTDPEKVKEWKDVLEDPKIKKTGHNLKYDIEVLAQSGIELRGIAFDSMLASYLLHPAARAHSLDTLAVQELDHHMIPITALIGPVKPGGHGVSEQKRMSQVPLAEIAQYAAEDADIALRLYELFAQKLAEEKLAAAMETVEAPLVPVLAAMELAGVKVDAKQLKVLQKKVAKRIETLQTKIWKAAGEEFNVNSTQQLRRILYEKLKLPTFDIVRKQSGFSTAASELEKLHGKHPIIAMLEEYRELTKLQGTYIEPLPKLIEEDGRIHGEFNQVVAATGRLSSQNPNLQNIPTRTELGQEIRAAFVAERGQRLIKADYSQIELRLAAHMSQDATMIDAFRAGEDFHARTAAQVFGIAIDKVRPEQRRQAKTLNFGVLYGMGPQAFSRAAHISLEEARSFIGRYREQFSGLTSFIETTIELAHQTEEVATLFGRKRTIPEINSNAPAIRSQAERIAFNFPLQGTAADILKKAMIALHAKLRADFPQARMILTVHDELVVEAPMKEVEKLTRDMKKIMEGVTVLDVPLVVDVSAGSNWRDVK